MATHVLNRRELLKGSALLVSGGVLAQAAIRIGDLGQSPALAADATPDATATRAAELDELHSLQTRVAEPLVCTPPPTATAVPPTATPTQVPPAAAGAPLSYHEIWTITVFGIASTPPPPDHQPQGKLMQINMRLSHTSSTPKRHPLTDFLLIDDQGRYSVLDVQLNTALLGSTWDLPIGVGVEENRSAVFDVAADAGDSFILESDADPTFRVALTVEQRG